MSVIKIWARSRVMREELSASLPYLRRQKSSKIWNRRGGICAASDTIASVGSLACTHQCLSSSSSDELILCSSPYLSHTQPGTMYSCLGGGKQDDGDLDRQELNRVKKQMKMDKEKYLEYIRSTVRILLVGR